MKTIMLTGAGAPGMPGILKCLNKYRDQIRLIGADADANAPSRKEFDRFYTIPLANDKGYEITILRICKDEKVDLIIPVVTKELAVLASAKERFKENGVLIGVMELEKIRIANNKGLLFKLLEQIGIPTPQYYIAENVQEVKIAIKKLSKTCTGVVVKPVEGNGSRGVRIIDYKRSAFDAFFREKPDGMYISEGELLKILGEKEKLNIPLMVMKYLCGREYSVDIVAMEGKVQAAVCRVGLKVVSSNQTSSMVVDEPRVVKLCEDVVKKLRLSGNVGFDLKEDEKGNVFILEINPRLTGGIVTCLAAGANMPWLGIQSWLGMKVQMPEIKYGVRMQRYWNETFFDENDEQLEV